MAKEVLDDAINSAHFLSGKYVGDEAVDNEITSYTATCSMRARGDFGYLVLTDRGGEYGNVLLVGAADFEDTDKAKLKSYIRGRVNPNISGEIEIGDVADENGIIGIEIKVSDGKADITVGGQKLESIDMPFDSLGCVGVYKGRGTDEVYADDILVTADDREIFADDFDGNFVNELYPYEYVNSHHSSFDPFYHKTRDFEGNRSLVINPGFLLSETVKDSAPSFKKEFSIKKKNVQSAYLCMTALGSFEAAINGQKVSENFFEPGKMVFDQYLNYVTYDVKELLDDDNDLRINLFHGFFNKGAGYPEEAAVWGQTLAVKGALVIEYRDGKRDIIPTDDTFQLSENTRYIYSDIYQGEIIDDRAVEEVWESPVVDGVGDSFTSLPVVAKENEPVTAYKSLSPVSVSEPVPGSFVYDFGENMAGTVKIDLGLLGDDYGQAGQVLTFRYGELLNSDKLVNSDGPEGTVWTRNLQTARATDYYVFGDDKREGDVTFSHTYHGFRYLEVTGSDKPIPEEAICALALSSDFKETGSFTCSDETINRFYENSVRSLRSNMMDSPTDCSQRDERLGWTGDAQAVSDFAMYQFDTMEFYCKYLKEIRSMQKADGSVYDVAPANSCFGGHSCWGDSIVTIPWNLYLQYGDKQVLSENVEAAAKWVDYLVEHSEDYFFSSEGYGDHLALQNLPEVVTDTAWCAHSSNLVSRMYAALGDQELAQKYQDISDRFTGRWQSEFIREDASVEAGILYNEYESETAYSLGLAFELFPEDMRQAAADRLKLLSEYGGYLFYPGYSGMAFYLPSLCEYGYGRDAAIVMANTAPGGLAHLLSVGLTTNAESVDAFRYSGSGGEEYGDGRYYVASSLNHGAFSSVCNTCYKYILGIMPDEQAPGYEHFYIKPLMTEGIESASGSYESIRGRISVSWNSTEKTMTVEVPENSTCTVVLPNGESMDVSAGEHDFNW